MACLKPLIHIKNPALCEKLETKKNFISYKWFNERKMDMNALLRTKQIATYQCGQCHYCINMRRYQWVRKMEFERKEWRYSYMLTLTYDNEHLPNDKMLHVSDLQKFIKRLRKNLKIKLNYFATGEYGTRTNRPHYHIILFTDYQLQLTKLKNTPKGTIFKCDEIKKIWKNGFVSVIHCLTNQAFIYCASYSNKAFLKQRLNWRNRELPNMINELWKTKGSNFRTYAEISDLIENHFKTQFQPEFYCFSKKRPIGSLCKNYEIIPSSLLKYHYKQHTKQITGFSSSFKSFQYDKRDIKYYSKAIDKVTKFKEIDSMYYYQEKIKELETFKKLERNYKDFEKFIETNDIQNLVTSARAELDSYEIKKINSSIF